MRWFVWVWLVVIPSTLMPGMLMAPGWTSREYHEAMLLTAGLVGFSVWLIRRHVPFRPAGVLLAYLAFNLTGYGFQPDSALLVAAFLGAVALMLVLSLDAPILTIAKGLALLGVIHVGVLAIQLTGFNPLGAMWYAGQTNPTQRVLAGIGENTNTSALITATTAPFTLWWILSRGWSKRLTMTLFSIMLLCVIGSLLIFQSFGGFMAFALAVMAVLIVRHTIFLPVMPVAIFGASAAFWTFIHPPGLERWPVWVTAWDRITVSSETFLFGQGLGAWKLYSAEIGRHMPWLRGPQGEWWAQVHNDWLQLWHDAGIFAVIGFLWLSSSVLLSFWRNKGTPLGQACLASSLAWMFSSLVFFPTHLVTTSFIGLALLILAQKMWECPNVRTVQG